MFKKILASALVCASLVLSSCLKDPGTITVANSKSTVAVNEEVVISLDGVENFTCITWGFNSGPAYTIVSGGGQKDKTMTVKFASTGTAKFNIGVKNCKRDKDDCTGTCRDEYVESTITVQ